MKAASVPSCTAIRWIILITSSIAPATLHGSTSANSCPTTSCTPWQQPAVSIWSTTTMPLPMPKPAPGLQGKYFEKKSGNASPSSRYDFKCLRIAGHFYIESMVLPTSFSFRCCLAVTPNCTETVFSLLIFVEILLQFLIKGFVWHFTEFQSEEILIFCFGRMRHCPNAHHLKSRKRHSCNVFNGTAFGEMMLAVMVYVPIVS